jgi:hypothetical protein
MPARFAVAHNVHDRLVALAEEESECALHAS